MLEAVHGFGELLKSGWKPKRTIVIRKLGRGRRRTDWFDRVGRRSCAGPGERRRLFQHGRGRCGQEVRSFRSSQLERVYPRDCQGRAFAARRNRVRRVEKMRASRKTRKPAAGNQHVPSSAKRHAAMCRWAIWAAVPTTRCFCSIWVCLRPTSVRAAIMACITRCSITSPGSRSSAIPTSATSSRWRAFTDLECCACPSADVLPYDYENYGKEDSGLPRVAAKKKSKDRFGDKGPDFRAPSMAPATCRKRARKFCKSSERHVERRIDEC
jgi:hypothetical protein